MAQVAGHPFIINIPAYLRYPQGQQNNPNIAQGQIQQINPNIAQGQNQQDLFSELNRVLHISCLSNDTSEEDIYRFFGNFHPEYVRIILTSDGHHSGTALVQFTTAQEANQAMLARLRQYIHDRMIGVAAAVNDDIQRYREGEFCRREREQGYFPHGIHREVAQLKQELRTFTETFNVNFRLLNPRIQFQEFVWQE